MEDMDRYLSGPDVPEYLKQPSCFPNYSPLELNSLNTKYSAQQQSDPKDLKYKQYFNNLNVDGLLFEKHMNSSTSMYYQKHKIYKPDLNRKKTVITNPSLENMGTNNDYSGSNEDPLPKNGNLLSYPSIFSGFDMPHLSYHSTASLGHKLYIYGGLAVYSKEEYYQLLKNLTNDFTIPAANVKVTLDFDAPPPLTKAKLISLATKPNNELFKYSCDTSTLLKVMDIFPSVSTNENSTINDRRSMGSNTSSARSKYVHPKVLLASNVTEVSAKHWLLYGGFELVTDIKRFENSVEIIKRVNINHQAWLFDSRNNTFKEIIINVHPTYSVLFPSAIARFGHAMEAITIEENNKDTETTTSRSSMVSSTSSEKNSHGWNSGSGSNNQVMTSYDKPAVILIMGGYKLSDNGKSCLALNDIWKCEFILSKSSKFPKIDFADEMVCFPMGHFDLLFDKYSYRLNQQGEILEDDFKSINFTGIFKHGASFNWPKPRGFFSMSIVDNADLYQQFGVSPDNLSKPENTVPMIHQPRPSSPHSPSTAKSGISSRKDDGFSPLRTSTTPPPMSPHHHQQQQQRAGSPISSTHHSNNIRHYISMLSSSDHSSSHSYQNTSRNNNTTNNNTSNTNNNSSLERHRLSHSSNSSSSANSGTARSSPAQPGTHSFHSTALHKKSLVIFGGSTTLYFKVVSRGSDKDGDTEREAAYYKTEILGDMWWFNFQTESWSRISTFQKQNKVEMKVCGHSCITDGKHLMIVGGFRRCQMPPDPFDIQCENENQCAKQKAIDSEALQKFEDKKNMKKGLDVECESLSIFSEGTIYNFYTLNLNTKQWKKNEFVPISQSLTDPTMDYSLGGACMQTIKFESKLIIIGGDLKKLNPITNKELEGEDQTLFGCGISEAYPSMLTL
ncbi:hypothetical protein CANARDRAFT_8531 [[Candida] arabinofermentans NRRL YB-2248]|uniref:Uncharacterized protein n=1 Tax=[Candida] arabinofermentans NRRL YB-2248 TaxID=983967 RepID=A0A1E4SYH9_9ASCO|nr:hypothetical protein CANARDRAFT_8531 [[Candida] arabinofermentans NRRL YB-2248]